MKRWVMTSVVVLLFPVFSFAWNEPQGFMDFKWGMSESQVKEILLNKYFRTFFPGDSISVRDNIGDVHVYIWFSFIASEPADAQKSKLGKIELNFESKGFRSLKATFLERYGTPTSMRTATFTNALGANLTGDVLEWKGKVTTILLSQYGTRLDNGFGVLITKEMQEKEAAEERQKTKDAAKGLWGLNSFCATEPDFKKKMWRRIHELFAHIEFTEWTPDGHLRHSKFVGLREDKEARDVVREG